MKYNQLLSQSIMHLRKRNFLTFILCAWICWGCDFRREQRLSRIAADSLGVNYNPQRKQLGIPLLPDSGWANRINRYSPSVDQCWFSNRKRGVDSLPRHVDKKIYFLRDNLRLTREEDTYYSGRKFVEGDPDFYGWERIEFIHAYVNDTTRLAHTDAFVLLRGNNCAILHVAERKFVTSNIHPSGEFMNLIGERPVSITQADSVLKAWGLSRFKE